MVATRCIKCMTLLDDGGQYCDGCNPHLAPPAAPPAAAEAETAEPVEEAAPAASACPRCGSAVEPGAECECDTAARLAGVRFGGFFLRAAAAMTDWLIIGAIAFGVAFATNSLWNAGIAAVATGLIGSVVFLLVAGATPGKMLFGLKVREADGTPLDPASAFLRSGAYLFSGVIAGIGFLMMLSNDERQALHDQIAGTIVVWEK